jgi:hypothetical protein
VLDGGDRIAAALHCIRGGLAALGRFRLVAGCRALNVKDGSSPAPRSSARTWVRDSVARGVSASRYGYPCLYLSRGRGGVCGCDPASS